MSELKRTQLYDVHVSAGATTADFGGREMPIQHPSGIIAEHLYTRQVCGLFDVSHMGRLLIRGPPAQGISPARADQQRQRSGPEHGPVLHHPQRERRRRGRRVSVPVPGGQLSAGGQRRQHRQGSGASEARALSGFDCTITNISAEWASIAVQGPKSKEMLMTLSGGESPTKEPTKNSLGTVSLEGRQARIAKTGYTGEPLGYEVYVPQPGTWCGCGTVWWSWARGLPAWGARDTLRMEASFPLYGHRDGHCPRRTPRSPSSPCLGPGLP